MKCKPFTLDDFVEESNRIEGIRGVRNPEVVAHIEFLCNDNITVEDLELFVRGVGGKPLRQSEGMDVRAGKHFPPRGGPRIVSALQELLLMVNHRKVAPYVAHHRYETLHPFMDGNGRSGRVLWLHMMGGIERVPLGFLHTWYYQSLDAGQTALARLSGPQEEGTT